MHPRNHSPVVGFSVHGVLYGHTCRKSMDQPGKVASPARGQLNKENKYSPVPVRGGICSQHFQERMDQPGMVANPASGQQ